MSVYNGVTFGTSVVPGLVTSTVRLSVSDMDPIDRIDFLIVVEGSDRQVADPTTAPPDGSPGPWVFEKTVLLDPTNPTTVTPRAYFRDGTTSDADPVTLDPMAASGGGTLEVQDGAGGTAQTATRLVFPAGVGSVDNESKTATIDLDGHYAALEHRHPWSDLDGVPVFASRWPTLADLGINQGISTSNQPTFTGVALQPANPAVNNTGILMSSGAFAALELQTTDGAGAGHTAIRITHATAGGVVGVGRTDPSPSYRMDVYGAMRLTDPTGSKPNGTVAPAIELLRFERAGSLNYSYNEAAEFRIGHGGPSVYGSNLELWVNGGASTGTPDTKVVTFDYRGGVVANEWFRNAQDGTGLHNEANDYYWFADSASTRWVSRSVSGIEVRNSTNSVRGYLYFANDPGGRDCFGLLGRSGAWTISIDGQSNRTGYNCTPHANWAHSFNGDVEVHAGWVRIDASAGVVWSSWGGGWYMSDGTYIRSYANKDVLTGGSFVSAKFADINNVGYYLKPAGLSVLASVYLGGILSFGQRTGQFIELYNNSIGNVYGIGVQSGTFYMRTDTHFAWYRDGTHSDTQFDAGSGGVTLALLDSDGTFWVRKLTDFLNGAYYLQPSATSNLHDLTLAAGLTINGGGLSAVGDISTTGVFRDAATESGGGIMIAHVISRSSAAGFDPNLEAPDGTFQAIWD